MSRRVFVWMFPALLCSTAFGVCPAAGAVVRIAVVVLDDTGVPVPGARVFLTGLTEPVHKVVEADAAGQAAFENLPDGKFALAAEKDGFARGVFGSASPSALVPIALAQGSQFSATVVMQRFGVITGVVSDDKGDPAVAEVRVLRYLSDSGARRVQVIANSRSSVNGAYRFPSLAPGEYVVCARAIVEAGTLVPVPVCFGGAREPSGAALVRVLPADVAANVNFYLAYEPGARLRGVLLDPNGQAAPSAPIHIVRAVDDGFGAATLRTGPSGEFSATLPAGSYNLVASGATAMEVTLWAGATSDVVFPLGRGATLSGRVVFGAVGVKPGLPTGAAVFELVPASSAYAHLLAKISVRLTDADTLEFAATGIPPGEYQIRLGSAVGGWLPVFALAGGRDLLAGGVHIPADPLADITLALVWADAEIAGRLVDQKDAPVFDRKVIVFPADRRDWISGSGRVRWAQPDTSGRFEIAGLPAGRFLLAVIADAAAQDWTPALLEAAAQQALPISVEQGRRVVQDVRTTSR